MKNGSHLEVVASIKDMNTDLNREFEVGFEEYNQASRGFCPSKTLNLLRVTIHALNVNKIKNISDAGMRDPQFHMVFSILHTVKKE